MEINNEVLKTELLASHESGQMTDGFAEQALLIITLTVEGKANGIPFAERQEIVSRALLKLVRVWERLTPGRNPTSYIKSIAYTSYMDEMRKYESARKKADRIRDEQETNSIFSVNLNSTIVGIVKQMNLKDGRKLDPAQRMIIKREAIRQLNLGISQYAVAKFLGVSHRTVAKWARQFKKTGKKSFNHDGRKTNGRKKLPTHTGNSDESSNQAPDHNNQ